MLKGGTFVAEKTTRGREDAQRAEARGARDVPSPVRGILRTGFLIFAVVYGGLGLATGAPVVWPLFALYGLYIALTDGVTKAYITDLVVCQL